MRKIWDDFKKFAFKGNMIDLAVGVMIGTAFGAIVNSLVNDLFMPTLSLLTGRIDFASLAIPLGTGADAASIRYGAFVQTVMNFALIAACVFGFVKLLSVFKGRDEAPPARTCPYCMQPLADGATRCPHCTSQV